MKTTPPQSGVDETMLPQGLIIEIPTPLDHQRRLDHQGLVRLITRSVPAAEGLVLAGTRVGQGQLMEDHLWRELMEAGLEAAPRDMPLFLGLAGLDTRQTLERARWLAPRIQDRPAWGLDLPLYHHSNRGLPYWVERLARALQRELVLVNQPDAVRGRRGPGKRLNLMPSVLAKCSEGLAGVVHSGSLRVGIGYQRTLRQVPGARLYDGDELSFLGRPSHSGLFSATASLIPDDWRLVVNNSLGRASALSRAGKRRPLLEAAGRVRELAALTAGDPAAVMALLCHAVGLASSPNALAPAPDKEVVAAARRWAQGQGWFV